MKSIIATALFARRRRLIQPGWDVLAHDHVSHTGTCVAIATVMRLTLSTDDCNLIPEVTNIGALIITYTILGVPYYNYSIIYPQTLIILNILVAPILP